LTLDICVISSVRVIPNWLLPVQVSQSSGSIRMPTLIVFLSDFGLPRFFSIPRRIFH
jgi:hypothetical protein